jgi:predicted nucleotidyltransferase
MTAENCQLMQGLRRLDKMAFGFPMVSLKDIRAVAGQIAERFQPERIFLFGSYAYGNPTEDSDVDLLILMRGSRVHDRAIQIRESIVFGFPVDILVRSPEEYRRRIALGDCFLTEISEKGKVLYEKPHAGMGAKGGRRFSNRTTRGPGKKVTQL